MDKVYKTKSSDLRCWDQLYVSVTCFDSGIQRTYEGILYFCGSEDSVMVGCEEILCEYILSISLG